MTKSKEIFLIDSNSLITPYKLYYPFDFAKRFWDQLYDKIMQREVIILDLVTDELLKGKDELSEWIERIDRSLILDRREQEILAKYREILTYIQTCGLYKEKALINWAHANIADPWLIATAFTYGYTVITLEKSNGGLKGQNKLGSAKIPDVCDAFHVPCKDLFYMMRALSFRI